MKRETRGNGNESMTNPRGIALLPKDDFPEATAGSDPTGDYFLPPPPRPPAFGDFSGVSSVSQSGASVFMARYMVRDH